jgi:catechol 2,3-dioxygenase-like lactoylglutathione lyase family enzyme
MPQYKLSQCICITHPDQEKMVRFYQDVFGMDTRPSGHGSIEMIGGPIRLFFDRDSLPSTYFEFLVPDLEEARQDLISRGCEILTWGGVGKANYVRDPFGITFNIYEDPSAFV